MADFPIIHKIPFMPGGVGTDLDRSEDSDFKVAGNMPAEIYVVWTDESETLTLPTNFNRILGGWCYSISDDETLDDVEVNPSSADETVAEVGNLPTSEIELVIVVFGDK